jgi:hypothetical protein
MPRTRGGSQSQRRAPRPERQSVEIGLPRAQSARGATARCVAAAQVRGGVAGASRLAGTAAALNLGGRLTRGARPRVACSAADVGRGATAALAPLLKSLLPAAPQPRRVEPATQAPCLRLPRANWLKTSTEGPSRPRPRRESGTRLAALRGTRGTRKPVFQLREAAAELLASRCRERANVPTPRRFLRMRRKARAE